MLLLLLHHIAGDGWSLGPLARDLAAFYRARRAGVAAELAPLPVQYADYTLWQQAVLGEEDEPRARWRGSCRTGRRRLQDLPEQIELPARPAAAGGGEPPRRAGGADDRRRVCTAGLRRWRGRAGRACSWCCRPALAALLTRLGAGTDIAIGSPIAGRTDAALDDLIGFFVNTLVLRTDTSGNPSFRS